MPRRRQFAESETDSWFERNLEKAEGAEKDEAIDLLCRWLEPFSGNIEKLVEIGCGGGHRLRMLSETLKADGYGVDPSRKAVNYASETFPALTTEVGFGDSVPFNSRSFDLIHLGFYLYLVDRGDYLKCISEADRLLKFGGFLSIIDFDTPIPYSNEYVQKKGVFSHKTDNARVFVASGLYSVVNKYSFSHSGFHFDKAIDERIALTLLYKEGELFAACD